MSYYKYRSRDLDRTEINWSQLTKNLSDSLIAEKDRRESAKFDLETKHAEQLQKLQEFEQGLDPTANEFAMKQAQSARQFLLQNHKLMTGGFKTVDDSKLVKQRVQDTWTSLNDSLKTYNTNYKRLSELEGKGNEAVLRKLSQQLDLKNKQVYYDPNTGSGYYADVDSKGNVDMNTLLPVKAMNTIQAQEFETFDVNAQSAAVAQNVAQWSTFISSTQDLKDARLNQNYQQWIDNQAKSALSNDQKKASVLMDYLGLEYDVDGKPTSRSITYQRVKEYKDDGSMVMEDVTVDIGDVEMVLNKQTGELEPKLSPEQSKLAEDAYKNSIEIQIAREASKQYVAPRTPPAGQVKEENIAGLVDKFVKDGDKSALKSALAEAGFTGSTAPDENGVITLTAGDGTVKSVDTKGLTAKQVGTEIAGMLGAGSAYNRKSTAGSLALNQNVLDPSGYGVLSRKASVSQTDVDTINKALGIGMTMGTGQPIPPDANAALAAVQNAARSIGVGASDITLKNGELYYTKADGKLIRIGTVVGQPTTAAEILQKLKDEAAQGAPI